ncbi:dienelactone hydrolase family protein [Pseudonocardia sp. CA-107938]|uniref:dienelactone hydrolase family protein n=1 Tax=Pseudonocardia sp. CA-107938 TaxID=3240021 RepID=UPI003D8E7884
MCHSTASRPPAPPLVLPTDRHAALVLETAAGVRSVAYEAHPATPSTRGVVILPDVRGAHRYYRDLAVRFAEAGMHAVVIDYYGHLTEDVRRDDDFDWQSRLPQVTADTVEPVVSAAIEHLARDGVVDTFTVGFCFGGSQSWLLAASTLPVAGVIGFYGNPDLVQPRLTELHRPMLLLVAGDDVATPRERSERFAADLATVGVPYEHHIYDGAPHSFFDRSAVEWQDACRDAWERILAFVARRSTDAPGTRDAAYARLGETLPDLVRFAEEFAHGTIGARPGLTRAERELVTLGALVALGDTGLQLRAHAESGLDAGLSRDQLGEALLQVLPYAGFPRVINATISLTDHLAGE